MTERLSYVRPTGCGPWLVSSFGWSSQLACGVGRRCHGRTRCAAEPEFRASYDKCGRQAEAMIDRWMRLQGCGRSEAMRRAVEHASANNSRE
jgi:hypothetical protein